MNVYVGMNVHVSTHHLVYGKGRKGAGNDRKPLRQYHPHTLQEQQKESVASGLVVSRTGWNRFNHEGM